MRAYDSFANAAADFRDCTNFRWLDEVAIEQRRHSRVDDVLLKRALQIAIADPDIEKMRCLCWLVMGVEKLPKNWTNPKTLLLLERGES